MNEQGEINKAETWGQHAKGFAARVSHHNHGSATASMSKRPPMRRGPWRRRWLCAACDAGSCWMAVRKASLGTQRRWRVRSRIARLKFLCPVRSMTRGVSLRAARSARPSWRTLKRVAASCTVSGRQRAVASAWSSWFLLDGSAARGGAVRVNRSRASSSSAVAERAREARDASSRRAPALRRALRPRLNLWMRVAAAASSS